MFSLSNIPTEKSGCKIEAEVEGEHIIIWRVNKDGERIVKMANQYVGEHMLKLPNGLRQLFGDAICFAIREARNTGYAQAQEDMRAALGLKR